MNYLQVKIELEACSEAKQEMAIALLSSSHYEAFEETRRGLIAYVKEALFDEVELKELLQSEFLKGSYQYEKMPDKDWNEEWESNYKPVFIGDEVLIKSSFHQDLPPRKYEILIDPRMSFGTGHHETTSLMMQKILRLDVAEKNVLDMGTGTGVLGILCEMRGAKSVVGIDIDKWAYENAQENLKLNQTTKMEVFLGDVPLLKNETKYDLILANINRNVLLDGMESYAQNLRKEGILLLSGFYEKDIPILEEKATQFHLKVQEVTTENNWVCLELRINN